MTETDTQDVPSLVVTEADADVIGMPKQYIEKVLRHYSPALASLERTPQPGVSDAMVERAARCIAENRWSVDDAKGKSEYVDANWRDYVIDARDILEAALTPDATNGGGAGAERPEIFDPEEILQRLAAGDTIHFSQDGDEAWFSGGNEFVNGPALIALREKGFIRRVCDDEENYRGKSEYDTISSAGKARLSRHDPELVKGLESAAAELASRPPELRGPFALKHEPKGVHTEHTPTPSAQPDAGDGVEPVAYRYRYSDPTTGKPVWRDDGRRWNLQEPKEAQALYSQGQMDAVCRERDEWKDLYKRKVNKHSARIRNIEQEIKRLREALEGIARQKKTDELETQYDVETASFEDGYDLCIDRARRALNPSEDG